VECGSTSRCGEYITRSNHFDTEEVELIGFGLKVKWVNSLIFNELTHFY
jgi:hypothetical protein